MRRLAVVAFIAALAVSGCTSGDVSGGSVGELVDLPEAHPAVDLLEAGADYDDFVAAGSEMAFDQHLCSQSREAAWDLCLLRDDGIVVVAPLRGPVGTVARIKGDTWDEEVVVVFDDGPVAVTSEGEPVRIIVEIDDEFVGSMRGLETPDQ